MDCDGAKTGLPFPSSLSLTMSALGSIRLIIIEFMDEHLPTSATLLSHKYLHNEVLRQIHLRRMDLTHHSAMSCLLTGTLPLSAFSGTQGAILFTLHMDLFGPSVFLAR